MIAFGKFTTNKEETTFAILNRLSMSMIYEYVLQTNPSTFQSMLVTFPALLEALTQKNFVLTHNENTSNVHFKIKKYDLIFNISIPTEKYDENTLEISIEIILERDLGLKSISESIILFFQKKVNNANGQITYDKTAKEDEKEDKPYRFGQLHVIPKPLADYIEVEENIKLTGPIITRKIWDQLTKRGLQYKYDRRVFRVDEETSKIFKVPLSVNSSVTHMDHNGFNFCNLQKYIKNALNKN